MIRMAALVAELAPAGEGVNDARRCRVRFADGTLAMAYVKDIPPYRMLAEIVAGSLAIHLGLPAAEPILVVVGNAVLSGSVAVPGKVFRVDLQQDAAAALTRLRAWPALLNACGFDDWVANPDRNMGNLLHDGTKAFWLIDHEFALQAGLSDDTLTDNPLHQAACGTATPRETDTKLRPARLAVAQGQSVAAMDALHALLADLPISGAEAMLDFLRRRQGHLRALVLKRMPLAQGDIFDDRVH